MIECSLLGLKEYGSVLKTQNKKIKYGIYLSSHFSTIPGFGKRCWVVAANIDVDYEKYISEGFSPEQIVKECIEFLNTPPKSKYGKKRKRKPLYGLFHNVPHKFYLKNKNGTEYIQALLIVENRKRKHFWREGEKLSFKRRKK